MEAFDFHPPSVHVHELMPVGIELLVGMGSWSPPAQFPMEGISKVLTQLGYQHPDGERRRGETPLFIEPS